MKILLFTDTHWSVSSSMVNTRGERYSKRLELLIDGLNWMENLSIKQGCEMEVCLGDFCDKSTLNDEEISALQEIKWNNTEKYFIVGNHESSSHDLKYSTVSAIESLGLGPHRAIINEPTGVVMFGDTYYFIPYFVESDRPSFKEVLDNARKDKQGRTIVFSHNDIAGINYAGFISRSGFDLNEIEANCDLFLNGHLHNQQKISSKVYNLGSMSAHNFTNNSIVYKYGVWILDTDTMKLEFFENPYSLNFYKLEIIDDKSLKVLDSIKNNSVLSIKYSNDIETELRDKLNSIKDKLIVTPRTSVIRETAAPGEVKIEDLRSNHLEKLVAFCRATLPNTDVLETELAEICK